MRKFIVIICILLISITIPVYVSFAQEFVAPLRCNPLLQNNYTKTVHSKTAKTTKTTSDTLGLPFFEDFTGNSIYPDSSKWMDFEVFINNTMGVSPISRGVATFDDLNPIGIPYDSFNNADFRYADSLTSKPIDLSSDSVSDSLYLSFFYQPQGNGFYPLIQDSLMLFMKTSYGGFVNVWTVAGSSLQPFQQVMIPITDSLYFHNSFQFRFVNIAALYWADAVWNVDYIRLDKNRNMNDTAINDIAFSSDQSFLLNDYTSMPYRQFMADPSGETAMQYSDSINNNWAIPQAVTYGFTATALNTGTLLQPVVFNTTSLAAGSIQKLTNTGYTTTIPLSPVNSDAKVVFENTCFIQSTTTTGPTDNDTIVKDIVFDNYLAYDDGTAEKSYYLSLFPTLPGKVEIEYHLNQPDTLQGMAIYFGRQIPFPSYKAFSILVYSAIAGVNGAYADNLLLEQDLNIPFYVDTVNHFTIYKLDSPLYLPAGTFYAGTMQPAGSGDDSIYFGMDVNRIGGNHAYYNVLNVWEPSLFSGAIMMRPLLGHAVTGSGVHDIQNKNTQWQVFPNPAKDVLQFGFDGDDKPAYRITDIQGRTVLQGIVPNEKKIDISQLMQGMYFVNLISDGIPMTPQKFIKL